jgi:hypothetical protein
VANNAPSREPDKRHTPVLPSSPDEMPCTGEQTMLGWLPLRDRRGGNVGSATKVGPTVQTVLGLSMTATSVGWVLVDGREADDATLDHDAFDIHSGGGVNSANTFQHAAAARGAQAIATASGHQVHSIGVTWSDDVDTEATLLLQSLTASGFDNVVAVRLPRATQAWARGIGRVNGYEQTAVCIIEPAAVTVLIVDTGDGALPIAVTHTRDSAAGLIQWLTAVFDRNRRQPDGLFLVGARSDLDAITGALDEALPMPVFASSEAQLALARGAALALGKDADVTELQVGEGPDDDKPAHGRSWLASHTKASRFGAVVVTCVIALFAVGPQHAAEKDSRPAENRPAANTSLAPASAHAVPLPVVAPPAPQPSPLADEPPRAPVPTAAPPVTVAAAPPVTVAAAPPVTVAAAPPVTVAAAPPVTVAAAPPVTVAAAPPGPAPQEPNTPPPVAPDPVSQPPPAADPIAGVLSPLLGALP